MFCKISNTFNGAMGVHNVAWHFEFLSSTLAMVHLWGLKDLNFLLHESPLHPSTQVTTNDNSKYIIHFSTWNETTNTIVCSHDSHWITLYCMPCGTTHPTMLNNQYSWNSYIISPKGVLYTAETWNNVS